MELMAIRTLNIGSKDTESTFVQILHYRLTQKSKLMMKGSNSIVLTSNPLVLTQMPYLCNANEWVF